MESRIRDNLSLKIMCRQNYLGAACYCTKKSFGPGLFEEPMDSSNSSSREGGRLFCIGFDSVV